MAAIAKMISELCRPINEDRAAILDYEPHHLLGEPQRNQPAGTNAFKCPITALDIARYATILTTTVEHESTVRVP
jgi:hypothetical protein